MSYRAIIVLLLGGILCLANSSPAQEPLERDFKLYEEGRIYYPGEQPKLILEGRNLKTIDFKIYKIDPLRHLAKVEDLRNLTHLEPSGRLPIHDWSEGITKFDSEGNFRQVISLPYTNPGVYLVVGEAEGKIRKAIIFISKLGIVTKHSAQEVLVWTLDLATNKPLRNVYIKVFDENRFLADGYSNKQGIFYRRFPQGSRNLLVIGRYLDNYATTITQYFLPPTSPWRIFLYTDRSSYYPSQPIFLKGMVVEERGEKIIPLVNREVKIALRENKGKSLFSFNSTTNEFGTFTGGFVLPLDLLKGEYILEASLENQMERISLEVEEYKKTAIRVELATPKEWYLNGERALVELKAGYEGGGPLANSQVSYTVYEQIDREKRESSRGEVLTNTQGEAIFSFEIPSLDYDRSYLILAEIVDQEGRKASGYTRVYVTQGMFFIYLRSDRRIYRINEGIEVKVQTLDRRGNPLSFLPLISRMIATRRGEEGYLEEEIERKEFSTDEKGEATLRYFIHSPGNLKLIIAGRDESGNLINRALSLLVLGEDKKIDYWNPGVLELIKDREFYQEGELARILVNPPFPNSSFLITIEGERILYSEILTATEVPLILELPLKREYFPLAYLTASLISNRTFLSKSVAITSREPSFKRHLKVRVHSPKERYLAGEKTQVTIEVRDEEGRPVPAELTISLTPLGVNSTFLSPEEVFLRMKESSIATKSSHERRTKELIPLPYLPTIYWNPSLSTDELGESRVELELPRTAHLWQLTILAMDKEGRMGSKRIELATIY